MSTSGSITVIEGPMKSGKTTYLIRYIETMGRYKRVLYINHSFDTRNIAPWSSHSSLTNSGSVDLLNAEFIKLSSLENLDPSEIQKYQTIIIDEAQFFGDLVKYVLLWAEVQKKDLIVAGLLTDFRREVFGQLLDLLRYANKHIKLDEGLCEDCLDKGMKSNSLFTRRIGDSTQQLEIGFDYRAVCRSCWLSNQH
jgi:thymidine kinase